MRDAVGLVGRRGVKGRIEGVPADGFPFSSLIRSFTFARASARCDFLSMSSMPRTKISKLRSGSLERERKGRRLSR